VQGALDQYGSLEKVRTLYDALPEPKRLVPVENADHFFAGKLDDVEAAVRDWVRERHPELKAVRGSP
jgi:hypothetical protein